MKLAKQIAQGLVDHHLIELTDLQSEIEDMIAAKLEPIREALKLCEWAALDQYGWDDWKNVCPDCRNTKQDGHAMLCCEVATALAMLEDDDE